MERQPVNSSHIAAVGWDDGMLEVEFKDGSVYRYPDVNQADFEALCVAPSVGRYLHQVIKPKGGGSKV